MKVYKVVAREDGSLVSAINHRFTRLNYHVGQTTRAPKDSLGVFCFDNHREASEFALYPKSTSYRVHRAIGYGKPTKHTTIPDAFCSRCNCPAPAGTICFPTIRLGKEIYKR